MINPAMNADSVNCTTFADGSKQCVAVSRRDGQDYGFVLVLVVLAFIAGRKWPR